MKKKYFFVTKVVPLLTFGLLSIALIFLFFYFFFLGFLLLVLVKLSIVDVKLFFKILKEEPSAGEHNAVVQECFSTSTL